MKGLLAAILTMATATLPTQSPDSPAPPGDLVDLLVWGADTTGSIVDLPRNLIPAVNEYRWRWAAYRSPRTPPSSPDMKMVYEAQVRYERRLVAIGRGPGLEGLAQAYVAILRPCYEWEGMSDCPNREARFADAYQKDHPGGPFADYLPLLAAHRWLCAAGGYEDGQWKGDAESQLAYQRALSIALRAKTPLVRAAAESLRKRASCFPSYVR